MKIMIADYAAAMMEDHTYELKLLTQTHPDWIVKTMVYNPEKLTAFYTEMLDADALLTAFIPVDETLLANAPNLKLISINAMGFNNIDLKATAAHQVSVCAISDYCSTDVAEFTFSLLLSLTKQLKAYDHLLTVEHLWKYNALPPQKRLAEQTLGICGLGKIGQKVAYLAKAFGMKVIAYDPFLPPAVAEKLEIPLVTASQIYAAADIITNHMRLTAANRHFFNTAAFKQMGQGKHPLFINVARGESVDEQALLTALEKKWIKGAGLDVLAVENPVLKNHPLLKRTNVSVTPHAAFYSVNSITELQRISCQNIVNFFAGNHTKVDRFVSEPAKVTK
ncbi:NAD(P)-dependent oxidoreductase [Liquorilactobacillus satsumensis]|uniref:NAD(P)-dependent oxidoreductase n=1 Tax=Liquorilactobacillus satsumensis TaxID=259059 RepID=UPI0021C4731F|nr:NAD(P)-dependent oxidoreductase [Liquorilactobacillus satsumensis]MCP9328865.1 hypothetical protein [Liquorilactobacillus satsumensis]